MLPSTSTQAASAALQHTQKWRGRVGLGLVACLSVLAGMTDAIGFMATGDFVSFMSGNTTRMAVAISDGELGLVLRLLLLVATFVVGNALGVVVSRLAGHRALPLLLSIGALLCASAAWPFEQQLPALVAAIIAMGMLNAAVEEVNGLPIGLTYVTGACRALAAAGTLAARRTAQRLAGATGAVERDVRRSGAGGPAGTAPGAPGVVCQRVVCRPAGHRVIEDSAPLATGLQDPLTCAAISRTDRRCRYR